MNAALTRIGLFAIGAIYAAMGVVSARVAFLGARDHENGVPGALRFLLERPRGAWILGAVVAGLAGIALAHLFAAWRGPGGAMARIALAVNAFSYAALAWTAARLLFHIGRAGAGDAALERAGVSWLLSESWGAAFVEIVGAAVLAGGLWEMYEGARGRLPFRRDRLPRRLTRVLSAIARFGLLARGLVLAALGWFLVRAAEELDPAAVRSVGGAMNAFSRTALGPAFMGVVGLGLAAYGVYMWTLALLKRRV